MAEVKHGSFDGADQSSLWELPDAYPLFGEGGYTRAFVKVQDGCDARCSFCVIPITRGHGRSVTPERVAEELSRLGEQGVREVVLSGIHLGRYGSDLQGTPSLTGLLRRLLELPRPERLRITSVEPCELTDELVGLVADSDRIAPHFHVPLQSGSDRVLGRMRRPYTASRYRSVVEGIKRRVPDVGIGADVMVGFPGETEEDFRATESLVRDLPLSYLHGFRDSARPDTLAASLPDRVASGQARQRSAVLRSFSRERNQTWRAGLEGRELEALTLTADDEATWALTGNYIRTKLPPGIASNRLLRVRLGPVCGSASLAEALTRYELQ